MTELGRILFALGTLLLMLSGLSLIFQLKVFGRKFFIAGIIVGLLGSLNPDLDRIVSLGLELPLWLLLIIVVLTVLGFLRVFASYFIGREAADGMTGSLAASFFRMFFIALASPFWVLRRMFFGIRGWF